MKGNSGLENRKYIFIIYSTLCDFNHNESSAFLV